MHNHDFICIHIIYNIHYVFPRYYSLDLKHCTDEYITRFLLARKYRCEQTAALIAAYQAQILHRQDIFGNLTARDPALQRALRAGIPGVLPARDRCIDIYYYFYDKLLYL